MEHYSLYIVFNLQMNIPTEHFHNIPVHTLSPIPLGQEALDILKVYER